MGCANHIDSYHESGQFIVLQTVNPPDHPPKPLENYVPWFEQALVDRGFHMGQATGPKALQLELVYSDAPQALSISVYLKQNGIIILRAVASNSRPQESPDKDAMVTHLVDTALKAFDNQLDEFAPQVLVEEDEGRAAAQAGTQPGIAFGTAFATNSPNTYVTARHVIEGADKIMLHCGPGQDAPASVLAVDSSNDLAVLRSDLKAPAFLELAPNDSAAPGDRVFTMGFPTPDLLGIQPKYTDGAISSLTGLGDTRSLMQITVPIQPGNSGGPLVDAKGRVVGVIDSTAAVESFYHMTGVMPQNVNFAVGSYYLYPLVKDIPHTPTTAFAKLTPVQRVTKSLCLVVTQIPAGDAH
jgi:S1-C subfamily serine protease